MTGPKCFNPVSFLVDRDNGMANPVQCVTLLA